MTDKVFISYARQDLAAAHEVAAILAEAGHGCWMAPDDISGPASWAAQIVSAVRAAPLLALVLSGAANESRHVAREVDLAVDAGVPVLPLRLEDVDPRGSLEYLLRLQQWIDVFSGTLSDHRAAVVDAVEAIVGTRSSPSDRTGPPEAEAAPRLPVPPDSFIGRDHELQETIRLLEQSRVVTLMGFGGTGKTRLSLETAARCTAQYPDGAHFIDLTAIEDPGLLEQWVATSIGMIQTIDEGTGLDTARLARSPRRLLVFDNCEHVIDSAAAFVEGLTAAVPELRVLATSREPLRVRGEVEFRLGTLPTPPPKTRSLEDVSTFDSVRLFADRAAEVSPLFALSNENAAQIAEICRRVDGIPLAIELAAARTRAFTVDQISGMLGDRLSVLTGGRRSAAPRHQTLQAAIEWSYDTLTAHEKAAFRRLTLLRGSFDLPAARAVCGADDTWPDAALVVANLVEKSLVLAITSDGAMRYRMMETLREFGHKQLTAGEGYRAAVRRYVDHWSSVIEAVFTALFANDEVGETVATLRPNHVNVRSALSMAIDQGQSAEALRLAAGMALLWIELGIWTGGYEWLERTWSKGSDEASTVTLQQGLANVSRIETPADAMVGLARATANDGDHDRAAALLGLSEAIADSINGHIDGGDLKAQLRDQLGRAVFDEARKRGAAALSVASRG